jgi:hypothetical protein
MIGKWYVVATTFPMWLKGDKLFPSITYGSPQTSDNNGVVSFDDTVEYEKGGERQDIRGTDTQDPIKTGHFTWRGKGLLWFFSSSWDVVMIGSLAETNTEFMVITFSSTLFTPAGMDILCREPLPFSQSALEEVLGQVKNDSRVNPFLPELVKLTTTK